MLVHNYFNQLEKNHFELCLSLPFETSKHNHTITNSLYVWWNSKYNILLTMDTWGGFDEQVNSAEMYYNIKRNPNNTTLFKYVRSGHCFEGDKENFIWIGHNDARQGVSEMILALKSRGKFLKPWVERPSFYLTHYQDTKDLYQWRRISEERISMLPKYVQEAISPVATQP